MPGDSIKQLGTVALHFFYQQFRPASSFLRLKHFVYLCIAADAKLKQDEYDLQVQMNMRMRRPNAPITLGADNYTKVEVPINKDNIAELPNPIMFFSKAPSTLSVSSVVPEGNCQTIIPITEPERWMACDSKTPFWLPTCEGIEFINLESACNAKKVKVRYIPQFLEANADKSTVQESRKIAILNLVNFYVKSAKEGVVIDMSNNSNPNVSLQTEIDKYLVKALQG